MKKYIQIVSIFILIITFSTQAYSKEEKIYWDLFLSFEQILQKSDSIVTATVVDTKTERISNNGPDRITRFTNFKINEIIKPDDTLNAGDIITIDTYEGRYEENEFIEPNYYTPSFSSGEEVLLLLDEEKGKYKLFFEVFGKLSITNGKIERCSTSKNNFISEIKYVIKNKHNKFNFDHPNVYMNKKHSVHKTAKIETSTSLPNSEFQFRVPAKDDSSYTYEDLPLTIKFYINPTDSEDSTGSYLGMARMLPSIQRACSLWNDISDSAISFSVESVDSVDTGQSNDGISTICFGDVSIAGAGAVAYAKLHGEAAESGSFECDIVFKNTWHWYLANPGDDISFIQTIAHEMGHALDLDDMGTDDSDPQAYSSNLMWHTTQYHQYVDSPQDGDELGAVYCTTSLGSSLTAYNKILIGENCNITNNFTIPTGKTVVVRGGEKVRVDPYKKINVEGTLELANNSELTNAADDPESSLWYGVDIESEGALDISGSFAKIRNATIGLTIYDGDNISISPNKLSIYDTYYEGLYIAGCDADVSRIYVDNLNGHSSAKGLYLNGTGIDVFVDSTTVRQSGGYGIEADGTATIEMTYMDIQSNNDDHSIKTSQYPDIKIWDSNIDPTSGKYAIYLSSSSSMIDAMYNFWDGDTSYPIDKNALFNYPSLVDTDNAVFSSVTGAGAKIAVDQYAENKFKTASDMSKNGNYSGAISKYKEILSGNPNGLETRRAIVKMTRAHDKSDRDFEDVRGVIAANISKVSGVNRPVLDFVLYNLLVREGKYDAAIEAFRQGAEDYKGTSFEVEMIAKIAMIYGVQMRDKTNAKYYADQAAALNPGQPILQAAYGSADVEYYPREYTDRFEDVVEDFGSPEPKEKPAAEVSTTLFSPSPNPFNPATTLSYSLANPGHVSLYVYNSNGQKVATLVDSHMSAGEHSASFDGRGMASGMYFYRFEAGGFEKSGKMILVK
jgi:hypothetical protein